MDHSLIESLATNGRPFELVTASGERFRIPHRDFVSFTPRRTALIVYFYGEGDDPNKEPRFAYVPLMTVTSASLLEQPAAS